MDRHTLSRFLYIRWPSTSKRSKSFMEPFFTQIWIEQTIDKKDGVIFLAKYFEYERLVWWNETLGKIAQ